MQTEALTHETTLESYRLSPQQKHLWRLQGAGASGVYSSYCAALIEGPLDTSALREAVEKIVERHKVLRTDLQLLDGSAWPSQVIAVSRGEVEIVEHDLRSLTEREQSERIEAILRDARSRPEAPGRLAKLNVSLARLDAERCMLLVSSWAMFADAAGLRNVVAEIGRGYGLIVAGERDASESVEYADVSELFNELLEDEDSQLGREYWQRQNLASLEVGRLDCERKPDASRAKFDPEVIRRRLSSQLAEQVAEASAARGASVAQWLLACWHVLLWRLNGRAEVLVGHAYGNRNYDGLQETIGLFKRYLPIHLRLSKSLSFEDVLRQVAGAEEEAGEWQDYFSWEQLADANAGQCFADFAFDHEPAPAQFRSAGLVFSITGQYSCADRYKLKLVCLHTADRALDLELHYDASLFAHDDAARTLERFVTLLDSTLAAPAHSITRLQLVTEAERALLREWNRTTRLPDEPSLPLHTLFEQQAARTPDATALTFDSRHLTYRQLDARASRLARLLRSRGLGPDTLVALLVERSEALVVSILGTLKAGAAYLPLDPSSPADRLSFMLADSGARVLVVGGEQSRSLAGELAADGVTVIDLEEFEQSRHDDEPVAGVEVSPDNLAYVIYTSGSTGRPKGVSVTHGNVTRLFSASDQHFRFATSDVWTLFHSAAFDFSVWELWGALLYGGRLVVVPYWVSRTPDAFRRLLAEEGVTMLSQTPSAFRQLMAEDERVSVGGEGDDLRLRGVVFGGEALEMGSLRGWVARRGAERPRLINMYGITETTVHVTFAEVSAAEAEEGGASRIGRALSDLAVYVLDGEMEAAGVGVTGEFYVGGAGVARGYLNRPGLTAERFVPDPFGDEEGARLYRTGDLGRYREDGELEYAGRADDQVKVRGFRIELGEVESAVRELEGVGECVVVAREDDGGSGKRLVAYVVVGRTEGSGRTGAAHWRESLKRHLPDYMIPSSFVVLDRLPLTANGKVDKRALPAPTASGEECVGYVAPRDEVEALLCEVWGEVLRAGRVGLHDNFFSLGGDSILGIQVVARANRSGLRLSPRMIFQHQTVAELAEAAREEGTAEPSGAGEAPEQGEVTGNVPLTPIQHRFFRQGRPDPHHFNQSLLLSSRRPLERRLLEGAAEALLRQHDGLRLRFSRGEGGVWGQWCAPYEEGDAARGVLCYDLSGLAPDERAEALGREAERIQSGFDLGEGPLVRMGYFQMERGGEGRLLIVIHHLCVDGVSWRVLLEDLRRSYEALREGGAVDLGPKTSSYRQWALRLEEYASSGEAREETGYWLDVAGSAGERLPRGGESVASKGLEEDTRVASALMGEAETRALLQEVCGAYRAQIQEVLLAALAEAVCGWAGAERVLCDVEGHGRESEFVGGGLDVTRTVGWFTTVYPVVLERGGDAGGVVEGLRRMKERLRGVSGGGIGYGVARYVSGGEVGKGLSGVGEAELSFNYLGQFDGALGEDGEWGVGGEWSGSAHSGRGEREHVLSITASVMGGRLSVGVGYSRREYGEEEMEGLARRYVEALEELIEKRGEGGGLTPSDFPLAQIEQAQLDDALGEVEFE